MTVLNKSNHKSCEHLICIPEFLGSTNDRPDRGCGAKAACVSIPRLVNILAKSGAKTCEGVNGDFKGKRPRLVSIIFDTNDFALGIFTPRAPKQITLTDGPNKLVQAVGPADEKGGQFMSLPFDYIGGVKECVELASYQTDSTVFTALIN